MRTAEQMAGESLPPAQLLFPIGRWNERQHGMIITCAQDLNDALVLQMPQQVATFDNAICTLLEIRIGQRLQQSPRKREVHAPELLIIPQRARDTVQGKKNLFGRPFVVRKQVLEITRRL